MNSDPVADTAGGVMSLSVATNASVVTYRLVSAWMNWIAVELLVIALGPPSPDQIRVHFASDALDVRADALS